MTNRPGTILVGLAAAGFSVLYLISDLIELGQGGFSTPQLILTYFAEAAIPLFVLGLYAAQRPRIGWPGLLSAVVYAYTFVYFTSTVVYALIERTGDWPALQDRLGVWLTLHSVLMVLSGIGFGIAVIRARVFPMWTGATLIAGMLLMVITSGLPGLAQVASAGVRDLAFAAMGAVLLIRVRRQQPGGRSALTGPAEQRSTRDDRCRRCAEPLPGSPEPVAGIDTTRR